MSHSVSCDTCKATFAIPDEVWEKRVEGQLATLKCRQCKAPIQIDGRTKRTANATVEAKPTSDTKTAIATGSAVDKENSTRTASPVHTSADPLKDAHTTKPVKGTSALKPASGSAEETLAAKTTAASGKEPPVVRSSAAAKEPPGLRPPSAATKEPVLAKPTAVTKGTLAATPVSTPEVARPVNTASSAKDQTSAKAPTAITEQHKPRTAPVVVGNAESTAGGSRGRATISNKGIEPRTFAMRATAARPKLASKHEDDTVVKEPGVHRELTESKPDNFAFPSRDGAAPHADTSTQPQPHPTPEKKTPETSNETRELESVGSSRTDARPQVVSAQPNHTARLTSDGFDPDLDDLTQKLDAPPSFLDLDSERPAEPPVIGLVKPEHAAAPGPAAGQRGGGPPPLRKAAASAPELGGPFPAKPMAPETTTTEKHRPPPLPRQASVHDAEPNHAAESDNSPRVHSPASMPVVAAMAVPFAARTPSLVPRPSDIAALVKIRPKFPKWLPFAVLGAAVLLVAGLAALSWLRGDTATSDKRSSNPAASVAPLPNSPLAAAQTSTAAPSASEVTSDSRSSTTEFANQFAQAAAKQKTGTRFDREAADRALAQAYIKAASCHNRGEPTGSARVTISIAPSGQVLSVTVAPPFSGTFTAECIRKALMSARSEPFQGAPGRLVHSISIR